MSIIGNGSIAKLLNDREGFVFFASGHSKSRSVWSDKMEKERKELFSVLEQSKEFEYMIVYFGTISKFFNQGPYIDHKNKMESMIKELATNYTIVNLGNIWECTNPNTFINAYKANPYEPREEYKYMISKKQLNLITDNLPTTGQHEISIFGELLTVKECLNRIK